MSKLLFSLTQKDFRFDFYVGSGDGGQKKQKTSSACRCTHEASGAVGKSQDSRKQSENKKAAFKRCVDTPAFQNWLKVEISRKTGELAAMEQKVEREMNNVKVEVKDEHGRWIEEGERHES